MRNTYNVNVLAFATEVNFKDSGVNDASKLLKESTITTLTSASQVCILYKQPATSKNVIEKYTCGEALALLKNFKLIKYQYQN